MPPKTTAVPNALFDVYLKELKVAELKVLLVIIRQTLGWSVKRVAKRRKEKDWISNSQLRSKTGSSRRAISAATEVLVRKQLIDVLDYSGNYLLEPWQRKGKMRLYYRIAATFLAPVDSEGITPEYPEDWHAPDAEPAQDISNEVTALGQQMRITN